jgi:16S rRNA (uracil1498-N3)-methyltransferase
VERHDLASLAGFFAGSEPLVAGGVARLGEEAAHHIRVRRLVVGDRVYLADGAGGQAIGSIVRLAKKEADVSVDDVARFDRPAAIDLLVPIADRDRMLWCAEKCTELGVSTWSPTLWHRSRSVSPRGEGAVFADRVRARMTSALVQSHSPWLPDIRPDRSLERVLADLPTDGARVVLDAGGSPIGGITFTTPVTVAVGPEGGIEPDELALLRRAGFQTASLGANVLRFETAAVAALAIVRSVLLAASPDETDG